MGMRAILDAIENGEFEAAESPIAFRLADRIFYDDDWIRLYEAIRERKNVDPWLLKMFEGAAEKENAWNERGTSWASEVTDEGWKGFHAHLDQARTALTEAWEMRPDRPEAAALLIHVAMGGGSKSGEKEVDWFNRAVAAQMDYAPAFHAMFTALRPRCGGSRQTLETFGLKCLETGRFDTFVPLFYLRAPRGVAQETENYSWRAPFLFSERNTRERSLLSRNFGLRRENEWLREKRHRLCR